MILADSGKTEDAQALYAELLARARREYVSPTHAAIVAAADEPERAMAHLQRALQIRDPMLITAKYWPELARLRRHPRFQQLLDAAGVK